jgi:hypothetical protein
VSPRDLVFYASLPERLVRAVTALVGGGAHETAQLVLPRLVRRSRLYEATAKNLLRIAIELVGGVEPPTTSAGEPPARELALRKGVGNVAELASVAAFGFSPLWLLAAASDLAHGSRVYLRSLVEELKGARILASEIEVASVDELLGVLERGSGRAAALIDVPPLELAELRASVAELAAEREELPSPENLATLYRALVRTSRAENRPLLDVSAGVGLAFLLSARSVSRAELMVPYREDWSPLRNEGFAAYARRVGGPYRRAVSGHFDAARPSWTERLIGRVVRDV